MGLERCGNIADMFVVVDRVEYGSQCYCGHSIYTADGAVEEDCPIAQLMLCSGDQYEYCGGPSLLNLYQINF